MTAVPLPDQILFVRQHLAMFRAGLPAMVERRQITPEAAAQTLDCMTAVLGTLQSLAGERPRRRRAPASPAVDRARGKPVIVYFETDEARAAFVDLVTSTAPEGTTLQVPATTGETGK